MIFFCYFFYNTLLHMPLKEHCRSFFLHNPMCRAVIITLLLLSLLLPFWPKYQIVITKHHTSKFFKSFINKYLYKKENAAHLPFIFSHYHATTIFERNHVVSLIASFLGTFFLCIRMLWNNIPPALAISCRCVDNCYGGKVSSCNHITFVVNNF